MPAPRHTNAGGPAAAPVRGAADHDGGAPLPPGQAAAAGNVTLSREPLTAISGLAPLDVVAACRLRHALCHLLPGRLGLRLRGWSSEGGAGWGGRARWTTSLAADGAVCEVALLPGGEEGPARALLELQAWVQARQGGLGLGLAGSAPHGARWGLSVARDRGLSALAEAGGGAAQQGGGAGGAGAEDASRPLPGHCVDGELLVEAAPRVLALGEGGAQQQDALLGLWRALG